MLWALSLCSCKLLLTWLNQAETRSVDWSSHSLTLNKLSIQRGLHRTHRVSRECFVSFIHPGKGCRFLSLFPLVLLPPLFLKPGERYSSSDIRWGFSVRARWMISTELGAPLTSCAVPRTREVARGQADHDVKQREGVCYFLRGGTTRFKTRYTR